MLSPSSASLAVLMCSRAVIGDFVQNYLTDTHVDLQTYAAGVSDTSALQILYSEVNFDENTPFDYFLSKQFTHDNTFGDAYAMNVDMSGDTPVFTLADGQAALYAPQLPAEGELAAVIGVAASKSFEVDIRSTASVDSLQAGDVVVFDTTSMSGRWYEWFDGAGTPMGGWGDEDYTKGISRVFLEIEHWTDMSSFRFDCFQTGNMFCYVHNNFYVYRPSTPNPINGKVMLRLQKEYLTWTSGANDAGDGCDKPELGPISFYMDPYSREEGEALPDDSYHPSYYREYSNKAWDLYCRNGEVIHMQKPDAPHMGLPMISNYAFEIPLTYDLGDDIGNFSFSKPVMEMQFMSGDGASLEFAVFDEDNNMVFSFGSDYDSDEVNTLLISIPADGLITGNTLHFKLLMVNRLYTSPYVILSDAASTEAAGYYRKNLEDEDVVWGPMMMQSASRSQAIYNASDDYYVIEEIENNFVHRNYFGQVTHKSCPNYLDVETGLFDLDMNTFGSATPVDTLGREWRWRWYADNADRLDFVMEGMWQPRLDFLIPENCTDDTKEINFPQYGSKLDHWNQFDFEGYYVEFPIPDHVKEIAQDTVVEYSLIDIDSDYDLAWTGMLLDASGEVIKEYLIMEADTEDDNWGLLTHDFAFTASEIAAASTFRFQKLQMEFPYFDHIPSVVDSLERYGEEKTIWDVKEHEYERFQQARIWLPYITFHSNAPAPTPAPTATETLATDNGQEEESYSSAHRPVVSILMFALAVAAAKFQ